MRLYSDLARWWPLMSAPADYAEEAAFYERLMVEASQGPAGTLLELGSGGGNNASFLKKRFEMTLVEPSTGMLAVSQALNPEARHVLGDMRTVRLGRQFDCVFVHDAVVYMLTEADLRRAIERNEFELFFQPIHKLANGRVVVNNGKHTGVLAGEVLERS